MNRSLVLLCLAACGGTHTADVPDAAPPDAPPIDAGPDATIVYEGGTAHIRIVTGNLSSGNAQSYDPGEGIRIFEGLRPDVALVQEMNYGANDDAAVRSFVDQAFGTDFVYYRETDGAQIPNGIVSRFPIKDAGFWADPDITNRSFVWARIDVPGPWDLWAVCVHLSTNGSNRPDEGTALVDAIRAHVGAGYLVVGGDFNTGARSEPVVLTLAQVVTVMDPYPADDLGDGDTNSTRTKPYDWVLASPNLHADAVPTVIGAASFPSGLVFDSRVYTPLTDVAPVQMGDSGATNMQHMAVVRDFEIAK